MCWGARLNSFPQNLHPGEEFLRHGDVIRDGGICKVVFQECCSNCIPKVIVYVSSVFAHSLPCLTFSECVYFANGMEIAVYHVVVSIYVSLKERSGWSFHVSWGHMYMSLDWISCSLISPTFLMPCVFPINAGFMYVLDTHRLNPLFKSTPILTVFMACFDTQKFLIVS